MKLHEPPAQEGLKAIFHGKHYVTYCDGKHHYILTKQGTWYLAEFHELYRGHR